MLLTLLWKWLRGLRRPDAYVALAAPPVLGETELNVINRSQDTNNSGVVIFESDELSKPAAQG